MTSIIDKAITSSSSCDASCIANIPEGITSYMHGEPYRKESMIPYIHFEPYIIQPYQLSEISRKLHNCFLGIATMIAIPHTCSVICMKGVAMDLV
jgi:hypothetical protein